LLSLKDKGVFTAYISVILSLISAHRFTNLWTLVRTRKCFDPSGIIAEHPKKIKHPEAEKGFRVGKKLLHHASNTNRKNQN
jgi:hypothetical protein